MYPRALLPFIVATCSAVALALPGPSIDVARKNADIQANENDHLFTKYGLNKSAEYKYFHEPGRDDILGHYDIRYFKGIVSDEDRAVSLTHMTRAYLNFFNENNLETWIAHGTLLGWWWNGKVRIPPSLSSRSDIELTWNLDIDLALGLGRRHPSLGYNVEPPRRPLQSYNRQLYRG